MGYDSRVLVVNRNEHKFNNGTTYVYAELLADVRMCGMPYEFRILFDKEIDYELYIGNGEPTQTDMYNEVMTYTDCRTVIDYLEKLIADGETYRRLSLLLGLLKGFDETQWDDIQVVHYGC